MRILHVTTLVSPDGAYGGPVRVAANLSAALRELGHDVTIAAGTRGFEEPPTHLDGTAVRLFPVWQVVPKTGFAGLAAPTMLRWFRAHGSDFDLVHVHLARDLVTLPLAMLALSRGQRVVLQTHGMIDFPRRPGAGVLDRLSTKRVLRGARCVLYLTELERRELLKVEPSISRLALLPNGVQAQPNIGSTSESTEVLFMARLQERKQPLTFVEAAAMCAHRFPEWTFTLVGPDEGQGNAVQRRIAALELPALSYQGPVEPSAAIDRLRRAAVYVLPSIDEPFPMSVLESMSLGIPCIVTDSCGLAVELREHSGGLVTDGSVHGLEQAMTHLLKHDDDRESMGRAARQAAEKSFGIARIARRLEAIYASV